MYHRINVKWQKVNSFIYLYIYVHNLFIYLFGCLFVCPSVWKKPYPGPDILEFQFDFNPLNAELNPICYLLALLGAHLFLHVSRIRVKSLTLSLLMSYICGAPMVRDGFVPPGWYILNVACSCSPAEILGSIPTGGMDICLLWVSCVVR